MSQVFRWRVQLDCGCLHEVLTREDAAPPHEMRQTEHVYGSQLPRGQMICWHDDSPQPPYRVIAAWGDRRAVTFPADPAAPPDGIDPRVWSVIRHDEPHTSAFWKVTLACGHMNEVVAPDLDWTPASGPRRPAPDRCREMSAEFEEAWRANPELEDEQGREHIRRMLADGWPSPRPEQSCSLCPQVRMILAYERVGWIVPPQRKVEENARTLSTPSRATLKRMLQRAEAEAERLRVELDRKDTPGYT
ncbi:hypothetical protein [Streptomyces sp. 1222.5]|uniref:hypothetical protein n=1 Tax=Streptomyces sp. 1222.5 TaxID=1881026 RepID=UPI003D748B91